MIITEARLTDSTVLAHFAGKKPSLDVSEAFRYSGYKMNDYWLYFDKDRFVALRPGELYELGQVRVDLRVKAIEDGYQAWRTREAKRNQESEAQRMEYEAYRKSWKGRLEIVGEWVGFSLTAQVGHSGSFILQLLK